MPLDFFKDFLQYYIEKLSRKYEGMQLSLVLIAVDLESKRQLDGVLGGWYTIFTCTIFHYQIHANVNTFPIHVYSLDCAVHAIMIDVLHKDIFLKTGKWKLFRILHRTFMQKV